MNPTDDSRDEQQIEALLSAAARGAAPPDHEFLARLREHSTEVFQASTHPLPVTKRGRLMSSRPVRVLAACAAVLLLVASGLYWWRAVRESNPPLSQVLEVSAGAPSLHGRLVRGGEASEVWAEASGRLRRDNPDGTYEIAADGRMWRVNEKANRATSSPSPYHRASERPGLDLMALLDLPAPPDRERLADARPVGEADDDGVICLVYHLEVSDADGPVEVEALADRQTHRLRILRAKRHKGGEVRPLAELTVLAYGEEVPEEKFVVRPTLTEDGRVGKIADVQGVAAVKPVMRARWTPVGEQMLLRPGDWVHTDARGANAADLRLVPRTRVVVGPGSLVEVVKPDRLRVHAGEVEVTAPGADVTLTGPDGKSITVKGTKRYRVQKERLAEVRDEPRWLRAFKGKTSDESIGSLVALVDGRNVPLTVGYHKVTVDVRDQIARTVIEESFVNHTDGVLEGVFHFPLPAGASVSGFAMWVGDRVVEADIVEKQRAREIYETILQEKRDPGLLEWTGGNEFKARVYPIFAHSEKRIRITYTQVLPLYNGSYRYNYALQSELLQARPLRELSIDVRIHSAAPLQDVTCPTHPARLERTGHAAHVEFTAQEYTPSRDFEVVVEAGGGPAGVVLVPHRRGDDGYFLLQLTPPGGAGERDVLSDAGPLHLLILADTSASMDARQRAAQARFVAALLGGLTPRDTVNLACCDVECDWAFEKAAPAETDKLSALRDFLSRRSSLGWTDLDKAFASVLKRCGPNTQVAYVGDGIVTAGDADPAAFAKRLRRMYDEQGKRGTFHAVSTGSNYEAGVLRAVAALGGGSVRAAGGERPDAVVARELLREITEPVLRDLKVEFRGLRTARVYPEELPNLPAGSQHILIGRYLPEGRDQVGEVVVTGTRGGKPVRFAATVPLKDAEHGNSFLPRLWARMHLDHLLQQGAMPAIRDEIIALSEEYQIITPYTSLLVLESDADRARFKVKRTFRLLDGEKFFAEGRGQADYELKQRQMRRAAAWRRGLYGSVLRQFATLGRDTRALMAGLPEMYGRAEATASAGGLQQENNELGFYPPAQALAVKASSTVHDRIKDELWDSQTERLEVAGREPLLGDAGGEGGARQDAEKLLVREEGEDAKPREPQGDLGPVRDTLFVDRIEVLDHAEKELSDLIVRQLEVGESFGRSRLRPSAPAAARSSTWYERQAEWLTGLFPSLPSAAGEAKPRRSTWPAEAQALARSLLRAEQIARLAGGIEIEQTSESFDVRWDELTSRSRLRAVLAARSWLTRTEGDGQPTLVQWCDGRERGAWSLPFGLGRVRTAVAADGRTPAIDLGDYSLSALEAAFGASYRATPEPQKDGQTLLVLKHLSSPDYETRALIDTRRHVLLSLEHRQDGKRTTLTRFDDFVEVGGVWWARRVETVDDKGRLTSRVTRTVKPLTGEAVAKRMKDALAGKEKAVLLRMPPKSYAEAKKAVATGKATFDDHFALLRYFAGRQQWARAIQQLEKCEASEPGKPGLRWLRNAVLLTSRRHEELRNRLLDEAGRLAWRRLRRGRSPDEPGQPGS